MLDVNKIFKVLRNFHLFLFWYDLQKSKIEKKKNYFINASSLAGITGMACVQLRHLGKKKK
jgi:hypothetical protein